MRKRVVAVLCLLGAVLVLSLSGCGDTPSLFNRADYSLDYMVGLGDIQVSVQIPPDVYVNHPFTLRASISAPGPLTSVTEGGESLDDILRPPASSGSYSLCLIVDLHFDNDADFDLSKYATAYTTEQEFTLVPDVTTAETVQWTATPRDTLALETVAHQAKIRVWFDAETTCRVGTPSLLDDWFYLESVPSAKFTVVNEDLQQQRAITALLQPIAVAGVTAVTIAAVAWAAGVFTWVPTRPRVRRKQGASEQETQRSAATDIWLSVVVPGGALLCIGMVLITLGPPAVAYLLGADATLVTVFGGVVVALLGIVFLAMGVRRIRFASSAPGPPPSSPPTPVQGE